MNRTICIAFLTTCALSGFAQETKTSQTKTAHTAKPKKAAVASRATPALTIPAGAVKTPEGAFRYRDAQGKTWLYRETPFGVSRVPDGQAAAPTSGSVQTPFGPSKAVPVTPASAASPVKPASDPTEHVTAIAKGDTIQFQKPTPFGVTSWQKSKNDLTPDEQKIWEREQAKGTH